MSSSGRVYPQNSRGYYKGHAPFHADDILYMIASTFLQIVLLSILYGYFITSVKAQYGSEFIYEVFFVIILMITTDILAKFAAAILKYGFDDYFDYLKNEKKKKPYARRFFQYVIYTLIRSLVYAAGWLIMLAAALYPHAQLGPINFSYLLAWLLISLPAQLIAWLIALKINIS